MHVCVFVCMCVVRFDMYERVFASPFRGMQLKSVTT